MSERTRQQRLIVELAEEIGPRPATSTAEARAAAVVAASMRQANLEVGVQTFSAAAAPTAGLGVLALGGVISGVLGLFFPWPSLALCLILIIVTLRELKGIPTFASLLRRRPSQNVIGNRAALREAQQRIVLLCHLDSPRVHGYWRNSLRFTLAAVPLSLIALLIILLASIWVSWLWYAIFIPIGLLALCAFVVLIRELRGTWTKGTVDAAAVATAIVTAGEVPESNTTELWVVALGAGAAGGTGLQALLDQYPFPKAETWFINLPWLGRGNLTLVTGEGLWRNRKPDAQFLQMFQELQTTSMRLIERPYRGDRLDSARLLDQGYHAISLVGLHANGRAAGFRSHNDEASILSNDHLNQAVRVLKRAIQYHDLQLKSASPTSNAESVSELSVL